MLRSEATTHLPVVSGRPLTLLESCEEDLERSIGAVRGDAVDGTRIDRCELACPLERDQTNGIAFADRPTQIDALKITDALAPAVIVGMDASGEDAQQVRTFTRQCRPLLGCAAVHLGEVVCHPFGRSGQFDERGAWLGGHSCHATATATAAGMPLVCRLPLGQNAGAKSSVLGASPTREIALGVSSPRARRMRPRAASL